MKRLLFFLAVFGFMSLLLSNVVTAESESVLLKNNLIGTGEYETLHNNPINPNSGSIREAYVKGKNGTSRAYIWIENFYMKPNTAYEFSKKMDTSAKTSFAFLGAGFIPKIGPFLSIFGVITGINRSRVATEIRDLTQKGKGAQIIFMSPGVGSGGTGYLVREWNMLTYPVYKGVNPKFWTEVYRANK